MSRNIKNSVDCSNFLTLHEFYKAAKNVTSKSLGKILKRPTIFSVPAFVVRLLLGDFSDDILFGINIDQQFLEDTGFKFQCSNLFDSLKSHI